MKKTQLSLPPRSGHVQGPTMFWKENLLKEPSGGHSRKRRVGDKLSISVFINSFFK